MPSPQTITYPQATFSGGAILGYATYFPAQGFATAPNIYGTAWFGDNLLETMTITINPSFPTSEVSFSLFNGVIPSQTYTVSAFNASDMPLISQQYVIPGNGNTGFAIVDLLALGIAKVTITPDGVPSEWDFVIDSITLTQPPPLQPVPLPAALPLFATGVGVLAFLLSAVLPDDDAIQQEFFHSRVPVRAVGRARGSAVLQPDLPAGCRTPGAVELEGVDGAAGHPGLFDGRAGRADQRCRPGEPVQSGGRRGGRGR
jgi:hypothetical protein